MEDKHAYAIGSADDNNHIVEYSTGIIESSIASCCGRTSPFELNDGPIMGRIEFNRETYEQQRPSEALPKNRRAAIAHCIHAYRTVGLVRNMIDLMSDFASQGIMVVHPNKRIEEFYQNWAFRVQMQDRSERFLNSFFKAGASVVRRQNAKLTVRDNRKIQRSLASNPLVKPKHLNTNRREIPMRYTFLNPCIVELNGDSLATFSNNKRYSVRVPISLKEILINPTNEVEKSLVDEIPTEIIESVRHNRSFTLDPDNTMVFHYKKDDWQPWADPIIYAILADIALLKKMKLADLSALDGAIDSVRIYKLGNFEHKVLPTDQAFAKLARLLKANVGAGTREIIWGPDIEIIDSQTNAFQFLGDDKYVPVLASIYAGLGIPPTLTGTDKASGTTNNLVSLKTLIRRLEYGRTKLREFWNAELELVRQAMGFGTPAILEFENNNLGDEEAEKKLFIELAERDIVSDEFVQRKFGANPRIETARQQRERRERKSNRRRPKASPFHNPDHGKQIEKFLLEQGHIAPSEISALDLGKRDDGDEPLPIGVNQPAPENDPNEENVGRTGRPPNSRDQLPRQRRRVTPVTRACKMWAAEAYDLISETVSPAFLHTKAKKNLRSLSSDEFEELEGFKLGILFNLPPMSEISDENIKQAIAKPVRNHYAQCKPIFFEYEQHLERPLTIAEKREIQFLMYSDTIGVS